MYPSSAILKEGTLTCYVQLPTTRRLQPKQRYVVIVDALRIARPPQDSLCDSGFECRIYIYKDRDKFILRQEKDMITVAHQTFCGLEHGSIKIGNDRKMSGSYLNIICQDRTIKLQTSPSGKSKDECLEEWKSIIGTHMKTKKTFTLRASHVTCSHLPPEKQTSKVLLCITLHAISLCNQQTHLCLKRWDLQMYTCHTHIEALPQEGDVSQERPSLCYMIRITFIPIQGNDGETLSFKSSRAYQIMETIKGVEIASDYLMFDPPPRPQSLPNDYIHTILFRFDKFYKEMRPKSNEDFREMDAGSNGKEYDLDINSWAGDHLIDVAQAARNLMSPRHSWAGVSSQREQFSRRPRPPSSPGVYMEEFPFPRLSSIEEAVTDDNLSDGFHESDTSLHNSEIWEDNIVNTVWQTLRSVPPSPDTLQLDLQKRRELCFRLYSISDVLNITDWEDMGERLGLKPEALTIIKAVVLNHRIPESAAEIVLRHWQFAFNKYGTDEEHCKWPCTQTELIKLLTDMERHDLVDFIQPHEIPTSTRL